MYAYVSVFFVLRIIFLSYLRMYIMYVYMYVSIQVYIYIYIYYVMKYLRIKVCMHVGL